MPRHYKKGGSKASNLVMETKPVMCDAPKSPVITGRPLNFNINDLSGYATTGGRRKMKGG